MSDTWVTFGSVGGVRWLGVHWLGPLVGSIGCPLGVRWVSAGGPFERFFNDFRTLVIYCATFSVLCPINTIFLQNCAFVFRSHEDIIKIPSDLFYDAELLPEANEKITNKFLTQEILPNSMHPIIFHGVRGKN